MIKAVNAFYEPDEPVTEADLLGEQVMIDSMHGPAVLGMWLVAVVGAVAVLIAPLTPWVLAVAIPGTAVCLGASGALVLWLVRH